VSRDFVCVRLDSYESKEHQEYVRTFLDGRFENSAFVLLAPDGKEWLSKGSRGPEMVLGRSRAVERMDTVAALFPPTADVKQAIMQDFHSVRQALNVASADQRVFVIINGPKNQIDPLRESLRAVASNERIVGRFHFDFEENDDWKTTVEGTKAEPGIVVIRPGEFGMDGVVMHQLPLDADNLRVIDTLLAANADFAKSTEKKVYSYHVAKGKDRGIYFEGAVPYGEDRDGDGRVDHGGSPRGGGR
jgi:hypothetical protein